MPKELEVFCPEHGKRCTYNPVFDKYTCTYSATRSVAAMCFWSCYGDEAHKFTKVETNERSN